MQVMHARCAGLDVHKKLVVVCMRMVEPDGTVTTQTRTFATMTADLLALADWLLAHGITHVAMESTGEFWKPIYALLEGSFTVLVVNARHIKHVPGRKTDVKDAAWIAELQAFGLLRPSFVPPPPQRALRDLTRQRTNLVQQRAMVVNHLHKVLEWANLKLTSVVTDVTGVSARAMLEALIAGETDVERLADLARGRLRSKRAELARALQGSMTDHQAFMVAQHLAHLDFLDEQLATFDTQIGAMFASPAPSTPDPTAPPDEPPAPDASDDPPSASPPPDRDRSWAQAKVICDSVPGIGGRIAETIIAELGPDMSRFPSAAHAASWAKLCPGTHESAGKRQSSRIGPGNRYLRTALIQAAWGAVRVRESDFAAFYRRKVPKLGVKKAIIAVAHKLLRRIYTLLQNGELYQDQGQTADLDEHQKQQKVTRLCRHIERFGYRVTCEPMTAAAD